MNVKISPEKSNMGEVVMAKDQTEPNKMKQILLTIQIFFCFHTKRF